MCSTPKVKKEKVTTPDIMVTARDGQQVAPGASKRKQTGLRRDLNNSAMYAGLTIPNG
jgi:hypothetical protein